MKKILIFFFIVLLPTVLFAQWFSSLEYYTTLNYNKETGIVLRQEISISQYGPDRDIFVTLSGGSTGDPLNRKLLNDDGYGASYLLVNDPGEKTMIKDLSALPNSNEVLTAHLDEGNSSALLEYYIIVEPGSYLPYGYLTDSFDITVYEGDLNNYTQLMSSSVTIAMEAPRIAALSVVEQGGAFNESKTDITMDFGWLTPRAERNADIIVQANLPYSLTLNSINRGFLEPQQRSIKDNISYSCFVDGTEIDLSVSNIEIGSAEISDENGDRYALKFIIGDFWDIASGTYEDSIRVTLSAW